MRRTLGHAAAMVTVHGLIFTGITSRLRGVGGENAEMQLFKEDPLLPYCKRSLLLCAPLPTSGAGPRLCRRRERDGASCFVKRSAGSCGGSGRLLNRLLRRRRVLNCLVRRRAGQQHRRVSSCEGDMPSELWRTQKVPGSLRWRVAFACAPPTPSQTDEPKHPLAPSAPQGGDKRSLTLAAGSRSQGCSLSVCLSVSVLLC